MLDESMGGLRAAFSESVLARCDHMPDIASYLASMPDWINMTQDKYNKSWEALPLPAVGPAPPGISLEGAIKVR